MGRQVGAVCPALKVLGWAPHSVSMDYFSPESACLIEIEGCCPVMDQRVYRVEWVQTVSLAPCGAPALPLQCLAVGNSAFLCQTC